jgi:serine/threonine protein phosphatase PrpC
MTNEATGLLRRNGWRVAAATDPGRVRDHNEDMYYVDANAGIFLVVDGVGGHAAGEVAAAIAAETIRRRVERPDAPAHVRVREAITLANREILLKANSDPNLAGMACVLTLAVLEGEELTIGHVGDSRLYRLDARGISKLTHDHSPVGELEDAREISETDAMRDERRNEVYRDVGSEPRDPDADDFIELIRTRLDDDAALVICSDGLSDMLPALEINRIARQHAGSPDAAVAALIAAANNAGGKDNVTVLVVEGAQYLGVPDGGRAFPPAGAESQVPTLPLADPIVPVATSPAALPASGVEADRESGFTRVVHAVMRSRAVALILGVVLGLLLPLGLTPVPEPTVTRIPERIITVGGSEPTTFPTIGAALLDARPGDIVQVEPGEYAESLSLPAGVELRASKPGKVMLVAPSGAVNWTAIDAAGAGSTIRGFHIAATSTAPMANGVVVTANDVTVDNVTLEGAINIGVDVRGRGTTVRGSRFEKLFGTGIRLSDEGALLRQNIFRSAGQSTPPAVQAVGGVAAWFDSNVFMHFAKVVDPAERTDDLVGRDNFVIVPTAKVKATPKARR